MKSAKDWAVAHGVVDNNEIASKLKERYAGLAKEGADPASFLAWVTSNRVQNVVCPSHPCWAEKVDKVTIAAVDDAHVKQFVKHLKKKKRTLSLKKIVWAARKTAARDLGVSKRQSGAALVAEFGGKRKTKEAGSKSKRCKLAPGVDATRSLQPVGRDESVASSNTAADGAEATGALQTTDVCVGAPVSKPSAESELGGLSVQEAAVILTSEDVHVAVPADARPLDIDPNIFAEEMVWPGAPALSGEGVDDPLGDVWAEAVPGEIVSDELDGVLASRDVPAFVLSHVVPKHIMACVRASKAQDVVSLSDEPEKHFRDYVLAHYASKGVAYFTLTGDDSRKLVAAGSRGIISQASKANNPFVESNVDELPEESILFLEDGRVLDEGPGWTVMADRTTTYGSCVGVLSPFSRNRFLVAKFTSREHVWSAAVVCCNRIYAGMEMSETVFHARRRKMHLKDDLCIVVLHKTVLAVACLVNGTMAQFSFKPAQKALQHTKDPGCCDIENGDRLAIMQVHGGFLLVDAVGEVSAFKLVREDAFTETVMVEQVRTSNRDTHRADTAATCPHTGALAMATLTWVAVEPDTVTCNNMTLQVNTSVHWEGNDLLGAGTLHTFDDNVRIPDFIGQEAPWVVNAVIVSSAFVMRRCGAGCRHHWDLYLALQYGAEFMVLLIRRSGESVSAVNAFPHFKTVPNSSRPHAVTMRNIVLSAEVDTKRTLIDRLDGRHHYTVGCHATDPNVESGSPQKTCAFFFDSTVKWP